MQRDQSLVHASRRSMFRDWRESGGSKLSVISFSERRRNLGSEGYNDFRELASSFTLVLTSPEEGLGSGQ